MARMTGDGCTTAEYAASVRSRCRTHAATFESDGVRRTMLAWFPSRARPTPTSSGRADVPASCQDTIVVLPVWLRTSAPTIDKLAA